MSGMSAADTSAARPFCRKCLLSESGFAAEYTRVADMVKERGSWEVGFAEFPVCFVPEQSKSSCQ